MLPLSTSSLVVLGTGLALEGRACVRPTKLKVWIMAGFSSIEPWLEAGWDANDDDFTRLEALHSIFFVIAVVLVWSSLLRRHSLLVLLAGRRAKLQGKLAQ